MNPGTYPIYLVSLDQDSEKRETLKNRFPRYSATMTRINAVDGRKLPAKEFFDHIATPLALGHRLMLPGEVGCSLSHVHALESFLSSGENYALILEDDVIGGDDDIDAIMTLVSALPPESLLICGGQQGMPARKYVFGKTAGAEGLFRLARYSNNHIFRTCCYVVTPVSAKQILDMQSESLTLADAWGTFFRGSGTNIYYTDKLAHPKELSGSHLEQERSRLGYESMFGIRKIIALAQRRLSRIARKLGALLCLLQGYRRVVK
ncbi:MULTISPECIES: glycosyltransferase family 25 protein [Marinobacter]|uniref:glycosyltransferase family 25 protein n=1 Tax=Marinobacter TaxID=2742 RepID=UPI0029434825|nr:glycosyltransferase family 25 protein [Marinobacter salarius]WOI19223.1 glycosyltransferase family 25 protein [Marinobacter salarius]